MKPRPRLDGKQPSQRSPSSIRFMAVLKAGDEPALFATPDSRVEPA